MAGESRATDLKLKIDLTLPAEKLELVKNIVSLANSGGGSLLIGQDERRRPGITSAEARALDSARLADLVTSYIKPAQINLSHSVETLKSGTLLYTLTVGPAIYPIVISKQGFDPIAQRPVFVEGDIWIRHSTKTERVEYEDIRSWIEEAKELARNRLKDRLRLVTDLPEDADVKAVTSSGEPISSPAGFLENETNLRSINKDHLIEPFYLNWLFLNRASLKFSREELALLIASALRRSSTLYWWLIEADEYPELIKRELFAAVEAQDRDKSDAAKSIIDVGSVYLSHRDMSQLVSILAKSGYAHFKEEARAWGGEEKQNKRLFRRIDNAKLVSGELLKDKKMPELRAIADKLAKEFLNQKSNALARKLADVNIVIWGKRTKRIKTKQITNLRRHRGKS